MLDTYYPRENREYFVHKCIKILANRKRGNKFLMHAIRKFGQGIKEAKEETNPRLLEALLSAQMREGNKEYLLMNM